MDEFAGAVAWRLTRSNAGVCRRPSRTYYNYLGFGVLLYFGTSSIYHFSFWIDVLTRRQLPRQAGVRAHPSLTTHIYENYARFRMISSNWHIISYMYICMWMDGWHKHMW